MAQLSEILTSTSGLLYGCIGDGGEAFHDSLMGSEEPRSKLHLPVLAFYPQILSQSSQSGRS